MVAPSPVVTIARKRPRRNRAEPVERRGRGMGRPLQDHAPRGASAAQISGVSRSSEAGHHARTASITRSTASATGGPSKMNAS
jgi:hypothetical protein